MARLGRPDLSAARSVPAPAPHPRTRIGVAINRAAVAQSTGWPQPKMAGKKLTFTPSEATAMEQPPWPALSSIGLETCMEPPTTEAPPAALQAMAAVLCSSLRQE